RHHVGRRRAGARAARPPARLRRARAARGVELVAASRRAPAPHDPIDHAGRSSIAVTRRPAFPVLFWALAAALAVCHGIVAWHSLVVQRMWEDEAFNLTVPLNLLAGYGYTSDGALSGSTLTPFDARISAGPTVLLPAAGILA